jgi:hypothetical protein
VVLGTPTLLGKSSAAGIYAYGLPSGITTFVQVTNPVGSSIQLIQNISNLQNSTSSLSKYVLGFYLFPSDNAYNNTQTLTVSIGSQVLVSRAGLTVSASTVPYTYFLLPFSLPSVLGQYPLTFTFSQGSGVSSIMCLTGINVQAVTGSGSGYSAINPTSLALYYPLDTESSNFATGSAIADATLVNGATISNGALTLVASSNQCMLIGSWTPPPATLGSGMSFTGWFNIDSTASQNTPFMIFKLTTENGMFIDCMYNPIYECLAFDMFNLLDDNFFLAWSCKIVPNTWYFMAYTILSTNMAGSILTYTYYLNDVCLNTVTKNMYSWPASSFITNKLGNNTSAPFSGSLSDFRVYNRALSASDVASLWAYGYNNMTNKNSTGNLANVLDP